MGKFSEEDFETKKDRKRERKLASQRDRSKYKKTDKNKRERLQKEAAEKKLDKNTLLKGRVLAIFPEGVCLAHEMKVYTCTLRGILKKEITQMKNLVTVGDFVLFDPHTLAIVHIEERYSVLSRKEHLRQKQEQLIAANIDQVLIVVSVIEPPLKPSLVDRYIIASCKGNMAPVIIINKIDLIKSGTDESSFLENFIYLYRNLNIPVIPLSAKTTDGLDQLKAQMKDKASVFSGQSGVGKSSLINAIAHTEIPVGEIVRKTKKGSHTTSSAHLIPLEFGGWCIDTPGIRSFGIWDLQKEDLDAYFPEITKISYQCKFPNCSHSHEPDCAVKEAVEKGLLSALRFDSYLKLFIEIKDPSIIPRTSFLG